MLIAECSTCVEVSQKCKSTGYTGAELEIKEESTALDWGQSRFMKWGDDKLATRPHGKFSIFVCLTQLQTCNTRNSGTSQG